MSALLPESHPLAAQVARIARERGLDPDAYAALPEILEQVQDDGVDPRTIIVTADLVERLSRFDKALGMLAEGLSEEDKKSGGADVVL